MTYPPAPWNMHGQLWLSLFRVREGDHPEREPGVYGAALVSYEQPSPLTYSELLVARPVKAAGGRRVNITDIWVDSADSRDGGRGLWAIPKGLCDFERTSTGDRVQRTSWSTTLDGVPIASARFTDVSRSMLRDARSRARPGSSARPASPARTARWWPTSRAAPRRCRAAAPGSSTSRGRWPGWQASDPSRRSG